MKQTFMAFAMMMGIALGGTSPVLAHNPILDMGIGKMVPVSAWCPTADEAVVIVKAMHREDRDAVLKMYRFSDPSVGGSNCHNIHVMRKVMGMPIPFPTVELLEIHLEISAPDGKVTPIVKAKNSSGNLIYTWHTFTPNEI